VNRWVGLIDMDGSGLIPLSRLLRASLQVRYASPARGGLLRRRSLPPDLKRRVADAVNRGILENVGVDEILSSCRVLIISYVQGLGYHVDERDLTSVYQEARGGVQSSIIQTGIHSPGLMSRLADAVGQGEANIYYTPLPGLFKGKAPVAGPPPDAESLNLVRILTSPAKPISGLRYEEVEAVTLVVALSEVAAYSAILESGLILGRISATLPAEGVAGLLARRAPIPWLGRIGFAMTTLLDEVEGDVLGRPMLAGATLRVLRESNRAVAGILRRHLRGLRRGEVLVVGYMPYLSDRLGPRFKVTQITLGRLLRDPPTKKFDAAVIPFLDSRLLGRVRLILGGEGLVIDLSSLRACRIRG